MFFLIFLIPKLFIKNFQDVVRLTSQLPNLVASYEVPFPQWNHLDFCWAIDADTLLYPEILKNMEEIRKTVPEWNFEPDWN